MSVSEKHHVEQSSCFTEAGRLLLHGGKAAASLSKTPPPFFGNLSLIPGFCLRRLSWWGRVSAVENHRKRYNISFSRFPQSGICSHKFAEGESKFPQPTLRTEKDIGSENPENTAVSGFCYTIFQSEKQKISVPQNDLWGGLELHARAILSGKICTYMI